MMAPSIDFLRVFNYGDFRTLVFLYTDPGSGAFIWQLLVASLFGILLYLRAFIRRITATMSGRKSRKAGHRQAVVERSGSTMPNRNRLL